MFVREKCTYLTLNHMKMEREHFLRKGYAALSLQVDLSIVIQTHVLLNVKRIIFIPGKIFIILSL